jgi:hypothetical protein
LTFSTPKIIGFVLLSIGILSIFLSDYYQSLPLTFIALTITFWGFILIFIFSGKHISTEVIDCIKASNILTLNQKIADSNVQGKAIYIPFLKGAYIPFHIGAENEFIYVPRRDETEEIVIEQAFMRDPPGIRITPPGLGLADLMERKCKLNFREMDLDSLKEVLPSIMIDDLELAINLEVSLEGNLVHVKMEDPADAGLCKECRDMQKICPHVGCPLCSAIACVLTRAANKPVIIERCEAKTGRIEILYRLV